jgi:hypothetical protein
MLPLEPTCSMDNTGLHTHECNRCKSICSLSSVMIMIIDWTKHYADKYRNLLVTSEEVSLQTNAEELNMW